MLFTDLLGLPKFTNKILFEGKNLLSHDVNIFSNGLGNGVDLLSILPRFLSHTWFLCVPSHYQFSDKSRERLFQSKTYKLSFYKLFM